VKCLSQKDFWKLLLVLSILIGAFELYTLVNLDVDISGDGIPNRPQKEPPNEYPWSQTVPIIVVFALSAITATYSWKKITR